MKKSFGKIFWIKFFTIVAAFAISTKFSFDCMSFAFEERGYQAVGGEAILSVGFMVMMYYIVSWFFDWLGRTLEE